MQLPPTTLIRFAPGAGVITRGRGALQFGLDATRSGVIETPLAGDVRPVLSRLRAPVSVADLLSGLADAGMSEAAARSLVEELRAYRVIVADYSCAALLVGEGPLHDALSTLLRASGVTVRTQLAAEPLQRTLNSVDPSVPVVFVDQLHRARELAKNMRHLSAATLPVSAVDARVFIGPLGAGHPGPCLYCAHLYHAQRDEQWEHVVGRASGATARPDTVLTAAGAAAAAVVIRRLCGVPDPPGVSAAAPARGELIVADPFSPVPLTRTVLSPHPGCPVCY
ncbi:hypothetical protein G7Y29_02680 [Corynebacterium qintianiae]|uniref:TOMM leader peptide-binding protein n=1 Tax=Corynebacterium qintianiae TaxID=2709392 RepID=A0A7T0KNU7_9CORY|nr:hypothetical protein [Corynebacterium qintianiae]QPK83724.1 hypothetical protein G7Y29_02680 [Corynebacterium qintianiae]